MRLNGRLWLVSFILMTLITLPFAGSAFASAPHMAHASVATDHANQSAVAAEGHCDLMAKMQGQQAPQPQSHHPQADSQQHDCCDQGNDCSLNCPVDCGHCVSAGHGCMAALTGLHIATPMFVATAIQGALPEYSLLLVQSTKPPIIA